MQPDPSGSVAESSAQDTTGTPSAAPDTGPTSEGVSSVESQSGDDAAEPTPTPDSDESAEDDGDDEGTETGEQTEEQKKLSRRERQRQREAERIEREVSERIAAREREQQAAAEREQQEAEARKAAQARVDRLAQFVGVPDADGKPGTISTLAQEIADLNRKIRAEIADPQGVELEGENGLLAQVAQREARRDRLIENTKMASEIEGYVWDRVIADLGRGAEIPEVAADADALGRFERSKNAHEATLIVVEAVRKAERARAAAEIADMKKGHDSELATLREEMRGWRMRAGAEEVPDTTSGGQAVTSGDGVLTPERYSRLTSEERYKLRSTPEGRARIDRMMRSGAA